MDLTVVVAGVGWVTLVALNVINFVIGRKDKIAERLGELEQRVAHIEGRLGPPVPATAASPLRLTNYGEAISAAVSATVWAQQKAETLRSQVRGKQPYEIAELSFAAGQEYALGPQVREAMYEYGYLHDHVRTVLGIVLRDELFRESSENLQVREEAV